MQCDLGTKHSEPGDVRGATKMVAVLSLFVSVFSGLVFGYPASFFEIYSSLWGQILSDPLGVLMRLLGGV